MCCDLRSQCRYGTSIYLKCHSWIFGSLGWKPMLQNVSGSWCFLCTPNPLDSVGQNTPWCWSAELAGLDPNFVPNCLSKIFRYLATTRAIITETIPWFNDRVVGQNLHVPCFCIINHLSQYQIVPGTRQAEVSKKWNNYRKEMASRKVIVIQKQWSVEVVRCINEWANGGSGATDMKWKHPCTADWMNQWIDEPMNQVEPVNIEPKNHSSNEALTQWINQQWTNESKNQSFSDSMNQWISESLSRWINESMFQWINESMNWWFGETLTQWTHACTI
jgi:hypothetical protein